MTLRVGRAVHVEARPREIDVAFVGRAVGVVGDDGRFVFKRRDRVDVIDDGHRFAPRLAAVARGADEDAALGTTRTLNAYALERDVDGISRAVRAGRDRVVPLHQVLRVRIGVGLPGVAAVRRDI